MKIFGRRRSEQKSAQVKFLRQSVCMADDVEGHEIELCLNEKTTYDDVFRMLLEAGFLPTVSGNDVVWVLECDRSEIASFHTGPELVFVRVSSKMPLEIANERKPTTFVLKYYASPIERAKMLYIQHDKKTFHIWHEGFWSEYSALLARMGLDAWPEDEDE